MKASGRAAGCTCISAPGETTANLDAVVPRNKLDGSPPAVGEAPAGRKQEHLTSRSSERKILRFGS
jgi:hypothetical protein